MICKSGTGSITSTVCNSQRAGYILHHGLRRHKAGAPRLRRLHVRQRRSRCPSWEWEVPPAQPPGPQHTASPCPSGRRWGSYRDTGWAHLGGHGGVSEEPLAGHCEAPVTYVTPGLKESIISSRQKAGRQHCQLSGFHCKSHTTWDFQSPTSHNKAASWGYLSKQTQSKVLAHFIAEESKKLSPRIF